MDGGGDPHLNGPDNGTRQARTCVLPPAAPGHARGKISAGIGGPAGSGQHSGADPPSPIVLAKPRSVRNDASRWLKKTLTGQVQGRSCAAKASSTGLFSLPLIPFERYMLVDDRPGYPMSFVFVVELAGTPDRTALEAAFQAALARHPLLSARLAVALGPGHRRTSQPRVAREQGRSRLSNREADQLAHICWNARGCDPRRRKDHATVPVSSRAMRRHRSVTMDRRSAGIL